MEVIDKEVVLNTIGRLMERLSTIASNVYKGLDYLGDNIDQIECYPTINSIRRDIHDHLNDLKGLTAQLENTDADLQKMQNEPNQ